MDINITIKCPDLTLAASAIAKALLGSRSESAAAPEKPVAATTAAPAAPVTPVSPAPSAVPAAPPPTVSAVPTAPITPTPQITLAQLSKAGADLLMANPGAMPQLMGLLQQFGVQDVAQLRPEQIGAFATELRGLGAKI